MKGQAKHDKSIDLPATLDAYVRKVRTRLTRLERQLESAGAEAIRRGTKLLREVSEYLGRIEERGERAWLQGRREAARVLDRLERRIDPGPAATRKSAGPRKKTAAAGKRASSAKKKASARKASPRRAASAQA